MQLNIWCACLLIDFVSLHADLTLTVDHTMTILEPLVKARDKWYFIGTGIGCTLSDLDEIEAKHEHNKDMCLFKMLQRRIKQGQLTRSMLCASLRGKFVNRNDVAQEIEALDLSWEK